MAEQELTIEISDLTHFQIFCGNPECPVQDVVFEAKSVDVPIKKKCPACGTAYPKRLITALEHYLRFFEKAADASKTAKAKISLQVQLCDTKPKFPERQFYLGG